MYGRPKKRKLVWIKVAGILLPLIALPLILGGCGSVAARIDSHAPSDPANPLRVETGGSITLSVTFTNSGSKAHRFIAQATVWDSTGRKVGDYKTTLDTPLKPGQQKTVTWPHRVQAAGDYLVQFSIWQDNQTVLDQKPSVATKLIVGVAATPVVTGKFNVGDRVQVTQNLNVRTEAGTANPEVVHVNYRDHAPAGTFGKVASGPKQADGYVWWKVDFDAGFTGWVIEDGLMKTS